MAPSTTRNVLLSACLRTKTEVSRAPACPTMDRPGSMPRPNPLPLNALRSIWQ